MLSNHHEVVIEKNKDFVGPGHNSQLVTDDAGNDWIFYHGVNVKNPEGRVLMMSKIVWEDGWPTVENSSPAVTATAPYSKVNTKIKK